jgi:hypothetical protein
VPFDFSAPFVAARIILPSGDTFPLWTNVGGTESVRPTVPGTEGIQALAFVQEVQVILNLSGLPQISVQLAPPFEDGMKFLDSPLADGRMRNQIEVQLGYSGGTSDGRSVLSPPYAAALIAPEVTVDTEVQISLKGQGLGGAPRQTGRVVPASFERLRDVAARLAAGPGGQRRTLELDFSLVEEQGSGSRSYDLLHGSASGFVQGCRSDWLALWEIAQRAQCDLVVRGPAEAEVGHRPQQRSASRLVFLPRRESSAAAPVRRYRLYHYPGGQFQGVTTVTSSNEAEFPLLSFTCNTEAVWNARAYQDILNSGARMDDVNEDSVTPETTSVTLEGEGEPVSGGEGTQTVADSEELPVSGDEGRLSLPGDGNNTDARRTVQNEVAANSDMGMQCELEIVGDPTILPGDMIALAGLGLRFDNRLYRVFTVTHSIGLGGFATNLIVNANIDSVITDGRTPTGSPNTSDVVAEAGYTAVVGANRPPAL